MAEITQAPRLLASIKKLLTANNLTELDLGDLDEQDEPVYVIWYDNDGIPYDDPVLKVFLDDDGLSLEVDARNFGNTIRLYEDDFAHEINWLTGIRDSVLEILKTRELIITESEKNTIADLFERERFWRQDVKAFLLNILRKHGGRITFIPKNEKDEYPVTTTLYGRHDFPRIDISDLYLEGNIILADGIEAEEGFREKRIGFSIENEHLSDALSFINHVIP